MTTTNATEPQITVTQGDMAVLLEDPVIALRTKVISLTRMVQEQAQEIVKLKLDLDQS
jgi:hypothetical protein